MPIAHSAEWLRQKEKSSDEYLELKKHQEHVVCLFSCMGCMLILMACIAMYR